MKRWQTFSYDQLRAFLATIDNARDSGKSSFICKGEGYDLRCVHECPLYSECFDNTLPSKTSEEWEE